MNHFKGKQFQKDVIIVAVGYYLRGSVAKFKNRRNFREKHPTKKIKRLIYKLFDFFVYVEYQKFLGRN